MLHTESGLTRSNQVTEMLQTPTILRYGMPSIHPHYSAVSFGNDSVEIEVKQVVPTHLIERLVRVSFYSPEIVPGHALVLVRVAD